MNWVENFKVDGRAALTNFRIVSYQAFESGGGAIEAEADTGSRYVMYAVPAVPREGAAFVLVVSYPWTAVWTCSETPFLHPSYFVEHWGAEHRGKDVSKHHGGDVYALLRCATELLDASWPEPEAI